MRRLATPPGEGERGAVAVIVAILLVVLLGFAALAVDVGLLYSEKAQLQNGADAGALGIAQACAKGTADCAAPSSLAKGLADANSLDGRSNVQSIDLDTIGRRVTVTANPLEAGRSDNHVSLYFAGVLGIPSSSVIAKSTVIWGSPSKGPTPFPLTISVCQVKGMVDGGKQLIRSHSTTAHGKCPHGPSGADAPGGFGWLNQDSGCGAYIDLDNNESGANTGNDGPDHCDAVLNGWAADLNAGKDVIILLPVFNAVTGTGSGASYDVVAFAAFKVEGWKFKGDSSLPLTFRNRAEHHPDQPEVACRESCRGIIGRFVEYTALSGVYEELGPVTEYGATVVQLTN